MISCALLYLYLSLDIFTLLCYASSADEVHLYFRWGLGAIIVIVGHALLQIFAKRISAMHCTGCRNACRCCKGDGCCETVLPDGERRKSKNPQPKWRLGTILILVSSIVCFIVIVTCMGKSIHEKINLSWLHT